MLTGSEPYKLRGILSKGAQALMTRLGPSHERGPGTQPHIRTVFNTSHNVLSIVSEFSVRICYTAFYQCVLSRGQTMLQCIQSRGGQTYGQGSGPILHTATKSVAQCVQSKGGQILVAGQWP